MSAKAIESSRPDGLAAAEDAAFWGIGPLCGPELSRLRWRCRRGTKELDVLLERYMRQGYSSASAGEQGAFSRLLDLPDPLLTDYLFGYATPAQPDLAELVARIATPRD